MVLSAGREMEAEFGSDGALGSKQAREVSPANSTYRMSSRSSFSFCLIFFKIVSRPMACQSVGGSSEHARVAGGRDDTVTFCPFQVSQTETGGSDDDDEDDGSGGCGGCPEDYLPMIVRRCALRQLRKCQRQVNVHQQAKLAKVLAWQDQNRYIITHTLSSPHGRPRRRAALAACHPSTATAAAVPRH